MSSLKLHFLGAPQIELDGQPINTGRRSAVALIIYLAVLKAKLGHLLEAFGLGLFVKEYYLICQEVKDRATAWLEQITEQLSDAQAPAARESSQDLELEFVFNSLPGVVEQDDFINWGAGHE